MSWRSLADLGLDDIPLAGGKAARLGHLLRLGFPVPEGFVLLTTCWHDGEIARTAVAEGLSALGPGKVAVRSSGSQEDLQGASFAGQYESVLDVEPSRDEVMAAVVRCWESAEASRVTQYVSARKPDAGSHAPMAVLIQRMVHAQFAGVAYSADPVTGARDQVVIAAVRGLGEKLVSGESDVEDVLDGDMRADIENLTRRVAGELGGPQDIEWAIAGNHLYLLQARPLTGLPVVAAWECPIPRGFARHFRFGEWLGDPVTPLCESWLLTRMEEALADRYRDWFGVSLPQPYHVVLNGWYFYELPAPPDKPLEILNLIGGMLPKLLRSPRRLAMMMPRLAGVGIEDAVRDWRREALPRYRAAVKSAEARVVDASPAQLEVLVDDLAYEAGVYFAWLTLVAGFAAKAEVPLGSFYKQHMYPQIGGSHLDLLQGLVIDATPRKHAVLSLDWYFPTLGEIGLPLLGPRARAPERAAAERRAREAVGTDAKLKAKFEKLLATAQRFQPIREDCVGELTLAWPVMRRALQRLEKHLGRDIYFLERAELAAAGSPPVDERRATWEKQRRLSPPLVIGPVAPMARQFIDQFAAATIMPGPRDGINGVAASPGRVTGRVRVIRDASEFDLLEADEVLVAPATTPAWTPLFARAAAVVTDTGSIGSHASQVAREYGIPAVTCTTDATRLLRTGQLVTVDGNSGLVIIDDRMLQM